MTTTTKPDLMALVDEEYRALQSAISDLKSKLPTLTTLQSKLDAAEARELEKDALDAKRYRWWLQHIIPVNYHAQNWDSRKCSFQNYIQRYIDAALSKETP